MIGWAKEHGKILSGLIRFRASQVALVVKNPPGNARHAMQVPSLG